MTNLNYQSTLPPSMPHGGFFSRATPQLAPTIYRRPAPKPVGWGNTTHTAASIIPTTLFSYRDIFEHHQVTG
jgi:hypothetical protein